MLVSPDSGATKRTLSFARKLKLNTVIMHKQRNYNNINEVAHGSTGAGNDQVRFDFIFQVFLHSFNFILEPGNIFFDKS